MRAGRRKTPGLWPLWLVVVVAIAAMLLLWWATYPLPGGGR